MKLYFQRFIHHIAGLPDFSALKFTKYNQYESLILPMQKYLENAGVDFQFNTEVTNVVFEFKDGKRLQARSSVKSKVSKGHSSDRKRSCLCHKRKLYRGNDLRRSEPRSERRRRSTQKRLLESLEKYRQTGSFIRDPEKFCSDIAKTNWESATITTLDEKIIPYITNICKRDPRTGKVVTGGHRQLYGPKWLMSWTINRQGQFKTQDKDKVCVWVYGLFTDVPGDFIKNR